MHERQLKIMISGAGVAGLSAAYWLNQSGHKVTTVEAADSLRTGGYAVDVRGSAVDVLKKMGLYDQAAEHDTNMQTVSFVHPKTGKKSTIDADTFGGRVEGDLEVPRGDLVNVIFGAVREKVPVIFGDHITAIDQQESGVHVELASGKKGVYDLLIGADGVHSHTRELVYGDETPFLKSLGAQIAIASIPNIHGLDHNEELCAEVGYSMFVYSSDDTAKAMFLWNAPEAPLRTPHDQQKDRLAQIYGNVHDWKIPEVLAAALQSEDFYLDTLATLHMPTYSRDRYVLLGDAGYCASPASGQGTSLALVGAYLLAGELSKQPDVATALASYENLMRPFAEQNQALAKIALQGMIMKSRAFIVLRNLMLRSPALFNAANQPVNKRIQKAADYGSLPEYN